MRQLFEEKVNLIAALAFFQAIVTQLPPLHFDVDPDFMAVPAGMKFKAGIRGFQGKRGLASDWVGLGPGVIRILREGGQRGENGERGQGNSTFRLHGSVVRAGSLKGSVKFGRETLPGHSSIRGTQSRRNPSIKAVRRGFFPLSKRRQARLAQMVCIKRENSSL